MKKIIDLGWMGAVLLLLNAAPLFAQATSTFTKTFTSTNTPTDTITPSITNSATNSPTNSATPSATNTPTSTATLIPTTFTPTFTHTFTWTPFIPTGTFTFTPTITPTITPTLTGTPCATSGVWGETSIGAGSVSLTGTLFQKYDLFQPAQINMLFTNLSSVSGGTSIRMGIYTDGGTYPYQLIFETPLQAAMTGDNSFFTAGNEIHLSPGTYWLALDVSAGGAGFVTGGGGVTPDMTELFDVDMPDPFPADLNPTVTTAVKLYLAANVNTCAGYVATTTPLPTNTPTPTSTPVTVTIIYNNPAPACAGAFGCSVAFVDACRQLQLDFTTSYIIMRLGATCGCQPSDIMQLRATGMGWDEVCQHYGLTWASFVADLQTRIDTLLPEIDTPNMLLRGASYDPSPYPVITPSPMPDTLTQNAPYKENCTLCQ